MKKGYTKLTFQQYSIVGDGPILKGSLSGIYIEVPAEVPVKEYENGFATDDFEVSF